MHRHDSGCTDLIPIAPTQFGCTDAFRRYTARFRLHRPDSGCTCSCA